MLLPAKDLCGPARLTPTQARAIATNGAGAFAIADVLLEDPQASGCGLQLAGIYAPLISIGLICERGAIDSGRLSLALLELPVEMRIISETDLEGNVENAPIGFLEQLGCH